MTSLVQAKTINSGGVYIVGCLNPEGHPSTEGERRLSLDNVVKLTVSLKDEDADVQSKTYSLDELKDLQSKLMLIAGKAEKGKDEVEKFVKVRIENYMPTLRSVRSCCLFMICCLEKSFNLLCCVAFESTFVLTQLFRKIFESCCQVKRLIGKRNYRALTPKEQVY